MAEPAPWLVVGLGNPAARYAHNRHNAGFMGLDALASHLEPAPSWRSGFSGFHANVRVDSERAVLLKPQTFMNRSGESVSAAMAFFRVPLSQLVVLHDELDFEFGRLAVKLGGGHGGNNGLRDIITRLGAREFVRVRIGIGRPAHGDVTPWLLSDFSADERSRLQELLERASQAATSIVTQGIAVAMNRFNTSSSATTSSS